jgi:hypothetical protein
MGRVRYGTVFWNNWLCDVFEGEERVEMENRQRDLLFISRCIIPSHNFCLDNIPPDVQAAFELQRGRALMAHHGLLKLIQTYPGSFNVYSCVIAFNL